MHTDIQTPKSTDALDRAQDTPGPTQHTVQRGPVVLLLLLSALFAGLLGVGLAGDCGPFSAYRWCGNRDFSLSVLALLAALMLICLGGAIRLIRVRSRPQPGGSGKTWGLVVVLVLIIAGVIIPNFITSRSRSQTFDRVQVLEGVRAAIAAYAADATGNSFPAAIADWGELTMLVNAHGAALTPSAAAAGLEFLGYAGIDGEGDGVMEDYTMSFRLVGLPETTSGSRIRVSPSGIDKDRLRR